MVPKISAQIFSKSLLTGTFALISIGNAIASEIPTVQVSAVDRQSELLADSTDDSIAKIGGIYPINTLLNPDSASTTSNLALARRKKRIKAKPQIERGGSYSQPQIQNNQINTPPQVQNNQINTPTQFPSGQPQTQIQNAPINTQPQVPSGLTATQNQIQYKRNDLGVAVQFGNGTSFGIQGKLGLTDNISIRPEFFFGSGGSELENKQAPISETNPIGESDLIAATLDLGIVNGFPLFAYPIPRTVILTEPFTLSRNFLTSSDLTLNVDITASSVSNGQLNEAKLFPAGTVIPAGNIISSGTVLPAGTLIPGGTTIPDRNTTQTILSVVNAEKFEVQDAPVVLTADYKVFANFTPNVAIGNNPAGTPIPVGTVLPKGTILPVGTVIPVDSRTSNAIPVADPSGLFKSKIKQSTSLGLAVTYDFKLDSAGKSTAYLGPKIAYTANVGDLTFPGAQTQTLNTNETKIGLIAGLDYVLFDGFTIGANANYYFSRSLSGSATSPDGTSIPFQSVGGGSSTDFGLRIGYQF
jgi:hypothetical protein